MVVRWDVNETSATSVAAAGIEDDDDDDEESPRVVEYGRKVAGVRKRGATSVVAAAPPRPTLGRRTVSVKKLNVPPGDIDRGTLMMMQHRRGSVISSIAHPQKAQSNYAKLQQSIRHLLGGAAGGMSSGEYSERSGGDDSSRRKNSASKRRYRIRSVDHDMTWLDASDHAVIEMIKNSFKWTFLSSFVTVMLSACIAYVACCMFFAVCIYGLMRQHPQCFVGAGGPGGKVYFMDAYHLSWTTFSTVGYGLIGPAVGTLPFSCVGVNALMAMEVFCGLLYASLIGAIIFSKIARVQSVAPVRFSRVICVQYGSGVGAGNDDDGGAGGGGGDDTGNAGDEEIVVVEDDDVTQRRSVTAGPVPCPVLEFRVINGLSQWQGGEIIDAEVGVVACVLDEDDESDRRLKGKKKSSSSSLQKRCQKLRPKVIAHTAAAKLIDAGRLAGNAAGKTIQGARKILAAESAIRPGNLIQQVNRAMLQQHQQQDQYINDSTHSNTSSSSIPETERNEVDWQLPQKGSAALADARTVVAVNEGNSKLLPPRKYHKLTVETDRHPFFVRSWLIRHVLDASSPLLSAEARRSIVEHNGSWPFAGHEEVRSHLKFTQMIVTFSGTANASGSSVYAQHVYDFSSVFIGYAFVHLLWRNHQGELVMDADLLEDILEQPGGGAEPLLNTGLNGDNASNIVITKVPRKTEDGNNNTNSTDDGKRQDHRFSNDDSSDSSDSASAPSIGRERDAIYPDDFTRDAAAAVVAFPPMETIPEDSVEVSWHEQSV